MELGLGLRVNSLRFSGLEFKALGATKHALFVERLFSVCRIKQKNKVVFSFGATQTAPRCDRETQQGSGDVNL